MKKFLLLFLLLPSVAYAGWDTYAVERPDGSVVIHYHNPASEKSLSQTLEEAGIVGLPIKQIKESDIPSNRKDRDSWVIVGKKVLVDPVKKAEREAIRNLKKQKRAEALTKIGINEQELKDILEG